MKDNVATIDSVDQMLTEAQAAERLGLKPRTLNMWRTMGKGPTFYKIGGRVRYSSEDIAAYIRSRRQKVA